MEFVDLGRLPFREAYDIQERTAAEIAAGRRDEVVHFVEHPHTFTLGRGGKAEHLLSRIDWEGRTIDLIRINRGGDITYHGPGQLVGYPHLDLRRRGRDVHRYLRDLEEALIECARSFGVESFRRPGFTGVWSEAGKLASIGVGVRRWVTLHGFALNVQTDLRYFQLMHPCGIADRPMISLGALLGREVALGMARERMGEALRSVFEAV